MRRVYRVKAAVDALDHLEFDGLSVSRFVLPACCDAGDSLLCWFVAPRKSAALRRFPITGVCVRTPTGTRPGQAGTVVPTSSYPRLDDPFCQPQRTGWGWRISTEADPWARVLPNFWCW